MPAEENTGHKWKNAYKFVNQAFNTYKKASRTLSFTYMVNYFKTLYLIPISHTILFIYLF